MSPLGVPPSTVAGRILEGYRTGGRAHLPVDHAATFGWRAFPLEPLRQELSRQVGDHVVYRCRDCNDRWELLVTEDDLDG